MRIRNRAMTAALVALGLVASVASGPAGAAAAAPATSDAPAAVGRAVGPSTLAQVDCDEDQSGTHVGVGCGEDGGTTGPGDDGGSSGGGSIDAEAECAALYPGWRDCVAFVQMNGMHPDDMCGYMVDPHQDLLEYYQPDAPEGALLRTYICPREDVFYTEDTDWIPGGGPPPPTPKAVADGIWAEVQTDLEAPTLETWPPRNRSSVLHLPAFVAVTNWQGTLTPSDCDTGVCVELTATPTLSFDPGDETGAIDCEAGGTRFDPDGADPDVQASGDACAHPYDRRTGVDGRPEAWPGVVSITWDAEWQQVFDDGTIGQTGDFAPLVLSTPLPRVVTEWVSVVTNVAPSGR